MAGTNDRCTLGPYGTSTYCQRTCGTCGWNPRVADARDKQITTHGLTKGPDGLRRLIIREGGKDNGRSK